MVVNTKALLHCHQSHCFPTYITQHCNSISTRPATYSHIRLISNRRSTECSAAECSSTIAPSPNAPQQPTPINKRSISKCRSSITLTLCQPTFRQRPLIQHRFTKERSSSVTPTSTACSSDTPLSTAHHQLLQHRTFHHPSLITAYSVQQCPGNERYTAAHSSANAPAAKSHYQ